MGPLTTVSNCSKWPALGDKAFEQCAGFLRIRGGDNPLDGTSVHPEAYGLVGQLAGQLNLTVAELIGSEQLKQISVKQLHRPRRLGNIPYKTY